MVSSSESENPETPRERRPGPAVLSLRSIVAIFSMSQYSSTMNITADVQTDDERRGKLCWLLCGTTVPHIHIYVEVLQLLGAVQRTERYANVPL